MEPDEPRPGEEEQTPPSPVPTPPEQAPPPPTPLAAPAAAPEAPVATAPVDPWYWCPNDLLASEKPGTCPSCGKPFEVAPPWGIPAGPYRPRVSAYRRSRKEVVFSTLAGMSVAAVVAGTLLGLVLLYRHGTPLNSEGVAQTQQSAGSGGASGSSSASGSASGSFTLRIRSLGNRPLVLNGSWHATQSVYSLAQQFAQALSSDGTAPLDAAADKGSSEVAVFAVPNSNPRTVIDGNSATAATTVPLSQGTLDFSAAHPVTIAGRKSYTEELQLVSATGTTQLRIRFYVVAGDTRVVIIALAADPAGSGELDSLTRVVEGLQ